MTEWDTTSDKILWQLVLDWSLQAWVDETNPNYSMPNNRFNEGPAAAFRTCAETLSDILKGYTYEAEMDQTDLDKVSIEDAIAYMEKNFDYQV